MNSRLKKNIFRERKKISSTSGAKPPMRMAPSLGSLNQGQPTALPVRYLIAHEAIGLAGFDIGSSAFRKKAPLMLRSHLGFQGSQGKVQAW
jgi:hypothetical protein